MSSSAACLSRSSMTKSTNSPSHFSADDSPEPKNMDEGKFTSCMHFYKRDLTPVKENFAAINPKTPYR